MVKLSSSSETKEKDKHICGVAVLGHVQDVVACSTKTSSDGIDGSRNFQSDVVQQPIHNLEAQDYPHSLTSIFILYTS
jgi:hypothetical protein